MRPDSCNTGDLTCLWLMILSIRFASEGDGRMREFPGESLCRVDDCATVRVVSMIEL